MPNIIICPDCCESKKHHAKGLCHTCYGRKRYRENPEYRKCKRKNTHKYQGRHPERVAEQRRAASQRRGDYLSDILTSAACQKCGVEDRRVLVSHHRDPGQKEFQVTTRARISRHRLEAELAKCDVLCCNCHAIVHWEMKR